MTERDLYDELRAMTDKRKGLTETAKRFGFTVQFISDVVYERRRVTPKLAEAMGYRRIVEFERAG